MKSIESNDCQNKLYIKKTLTRVQRSLLDVITHSNNAAFKVNLLPELTVQGLIKEEIQKADFLRAVIAHTYWSYTLYRPAPGEQIVINIEFFTPITDIKSINLYLEKDDMEQLVRDLPEKMIPKVKIRSFFQWVRLKVELLQKGSKKSANESP
ncbi:hypothetical protein [Bacillus sp. FJAT-29937]|uniref:hypothetical protein n=1 Tax=Bacillus sp. FJAT-29937 TaxID=1720553 RepID=UPI001E63025C|nr:hypothetical protein [Bacillus sp. FJAT-29937]